MARFAWALLAGLLLVVSDGVRAADTLPTGIWKLTIMPGPGQQVTPWLVQLQSKDGKDSGETLALTNSLPKAAIDAIHVKDGLLSFAFKLGANRFRFEGKLPAEGGKKVLGSIRLNQLMPAELEWTGLKTLDAYEYHKEVVARNDSGPVLFDAVLKLLHMAGAKKAKPEEVRSWAAKASKAAAAYGPRYQLQINASMIEVMMQEDVLAPLALQYARQTERLLTPTVKPPVQRHVLGLLAEALKKAGKDEEAKEVEARIEKIPMVAIVKYAGRKGKGDAAVLVELFTGAECPPCVAADLAFDALGKTYKPSEVILLEYHLHIPGPDPLTNADAVTRSEFYEKEVGGTPTILFNGKGGPEGGGPAENAQNLYDTYVAINDSLLEKEARGQIKLAAIQKGPKIDITAELADVEKPGDSLRLRFVLVEETVKYQGGNRLPVYHHVVRAMPGGANGFAVKTKAGKQSASVNLDDLRKNLTKYLEDYEKDRRKFPNKQRPLDLKKLKVVAFIQDDSTKEVYQAAEVEIKEEAK